MSEIKPKFKPKQLAKYIDRLPPCNAACPAGENIQAWLNYMQMDKLFEAWETIMENNPFPAIHGRVCYHPCENACNRGNYDSSINMHALERFLGDTALQKNWQIQCTAPRSGKKALIIGAGPAGLSCAYHLHRLGHDAVIYEAKPYAGGTMRDGIPSYRLPRNILDGEIDRLKNMGIKIELSRPIGDNSSESILEFLSAAKENGRFDAIFLGIGAGKDKTAAITCQNPIPILGALDFLRSVETKSAPNPGGCVIVYGGGNTAIDVARTAKRRGIIEVMIVYRRDRAHMPAFDFEVLEAEEEGVKFLFLHTIKAIDKNEFILEKNHLDEHGKAVSEGVYKKINGDMLVMALGQDPQSEFLRQTEGIKFQNDGSLIVDGNMMTGCPGVFAGGDCISADRSVTIAVGNGKKAARNIDAYLSNSTYSRPGKHEIATYGYLHIENGKNGSKSTSVTQPTLPAEIRVKDFNETIGGISKDAACAEASRCFSCGNCFECDGCYKICPVDAISKLGDGKRYYIDLGKCIGCQKCYRFCPCGAITMIDNK